MLAAAWVTAVATLVLALGVPLAFVTWLGARRADRIRQQREQEQALTKALEQLGSADQQVRADGVYVMERVARDSARDYRRIMDVLTDFLREHSRVAGPQPATAEPRTDAARSGTDASDRAIRPDVQAAVTVIGRRDTQRYWRPINLSRLNLVGADIADADLAGASLTGADLTNAILAGAKLTRAIFTDAILMDADLRSVDLVGADLTRANYTNAILYDADLTGANLAGANLTNANLTGTKLAGAALPNAILAGANLARTNLAGANLASADLTNAILYDADLSGANLAGANLTNANLNPATDASLTNANFVGATWLEARPVPEGWVRDPRSGLRRRADSDSEEAE